jgi:hypothetical protein
MAQWDYPFYPGWYNEDEETKKKLIEESKRLEKRREECRELLIKLGYVYDNKTGNYIKDDDTIYGNQVWNISGYTDESFIELLRKEVKEKRIQEDNKDGESNTADKSGV